MKQFELKITPKAESDLLALREAIVSAYKAPITAKRYLEDLNATMLWLERGADCFPSVPELFFQYGFEIHRVNFKRMAILYSIEGTTVFIHRIMPQSMVIY